MNGTKLVSNDRFSMSQFVVNNEILSNDTDCYSELQIAPVLKVDVSVLSCSVNMVTVDNNEFIIASDKADSSTLTLLVEGTLHVCTHVCQSLYHTRNYCCRNIDQCTYWVKLYRIDCAMFSFDRKLIFRVYLPSISCVCIVDGSLYLHITQFKHTLKINSTYAIILMM